MSKLEVDGCYFSLFEDGSLLIHNGGAPVMNYLYQLATDFSRADAERAPQNK
jgi:hypothetical protein